MSEIDAFRAEARQWLEANCPPSMREPIRTDEDMVWGGSRVSFNSDDQRVWFETTIALDTTDAGTRVTIRQVFPTQAERDEVVEKYGAIEGGRQHLAKLEAYLRANLA